MLKDDAENISGRIAEADALIVGAPTYASSIPGQMKTLIDRGHFVMEQLLHGKYTLSIATYENADGGAVIKSLNKLFLYSGAVLCGNLCIKTGFNTNPLDLRSTRDRVRRQTEKLCRMIRKKKKGNALLRVIHHVVFHIGIRPFVKKHQRKFAGVIAHWRDRGIVHDAV
ncbi:MAG: flavodoxin family protein [Clostridiales bacterium]|nr:flavodoxin family protein [Clostridiales bacterium]